MPATRRIIRRIPATTAPRAEEPEYEPDEEESVAEAPRARRNNSAAPGRARFRTAANSADDDDEEDTDLENAVTTGWRGHNRNKETTGGDFANEFKFTEEATLVKFLENEPFASYKQHWIEVPGKKSWPCIGGDCPLCDIGDQPQVRTAFNIFDMHDNKNKVLILGVKAVNMLVGFNDDGKTGPIGRPDMYYALSRKGKKQQVTYVIQPVKERDVLEDWEIEPLTKEEIQKRQAKMYDKKAIPVYGRQRLKEIAEAYTGGD